jgi:DNA invertase Pin-like site-specific DNA recombinase
MAEPVPAAIYCRISHARDGSTLGVDRQEPPTRALCERLGWRVERVFVDNDLSAYHHKRRPDFEELLAWAQDGHIRAIAAWDADRLTRQPRENEDLIDWPRSRASTTWRPRRGGCTSASRAPSPATSPSIEPNASG